MTDFIDEASDTDLADQAVLIEEAADEVEPFSPDVEADAADLIEQHQSVPSGDDDYER